MISGGFVNPEKQEAKVQQNAYAPGVAVPPPQTTVIVQNVQFGPRPVSYPSTEFLILSIHPRLGLFSSKKIFV